MAEHELEVLRALGIFGSLEAAVRAAAFNVETGGKDKIRGFLGLRTLPESVWISMFSMFSTLSPG